MLEYFEPAEHLLKVHANDKTASDISNKHLSLLNSNFGGEISQKISVNSNFVHFNNFIAQLIHGNGNLRNS